MKITLVCAHYLPQLGYMEVHLARAFAEAGHEVKVVTSNSVPPYTKQFKRITLSENEMDGPVQVVRIKPFFTLGQITIARGLRKLVSQTNPELIVIIGLGKYFPKPVYDIDIPIITLLGNNAHSYKEDRFLHKIKNRFLFTLFKKSVYHMALDKSHRLVAYTPESFDQAGRFMSAADKLKLLAQKHFISLGFSHHQFYFDPVLREKRRASLGFESNEVIILTATRVVPEKHLENCIHLFESLPSNYRWLIVGSDGGTYATSFAEKAHAILGSHRFTMLPFGEREGLNAIFNAADIAFYSVSAISVFEALGSGLPCVLPPDKSLEHVLAFGQLAAPFTADRKESLQQAIYALNNSGKELENALKLRLERSSLARKHFSWEGIAGRLIEIADLPTAEHSEK